MKRKERNGGQQLPACSEKC